jgi:hypothetical protein
VQIQGRNFIRTPKCVAGWLAHISPYNTIEVRIVSVAHHA